MPLAKILAIDTSCDDTAVAILENDRVLSNIIASQIEIHAPHGGVVPFLARTEHAKQIQPCIDLAIKRAGLKNITDLDAIAVTHGPGLAPALEVGVAKAKELSVMHKLPLIAVNHLHGHLVSVFLKNKQGKNYAGLDKIKYPILILTVSGGHTEIILMTAKGKYQKIGQTLDDAAGEAFDKIGRMLGLGYPAGPVISHLAKQGLATAYDLPRPMQHSNDFDYSFSGLKTACLYMTNDLKTQLKQKFAQVIPDYCASVQEAIVDALATKFFKVAVKYQPKLAVVGGVSANNRLRTKFRQQAKQLDLPIYFPHKKFCTDNAAMIGLKGYYQYLDKDFVKDVAKLDREPSLTIN